MFLYYGKKITTAAVGARIMGVRCDKCGREYYFELTRIGTGSSVAHYGLGQDSVTADSRTKSQADVAHRLAEEAELVPCPNCYWINEELIQGFRRGRYRGWGTFAVCAAIVGIAACLIGAWFIRIGPEADRGILPYLLIYGPLSVIACAASVFALRSWLRRRIDPNRNFPLPPQVPRGTPSPLILDGGSGELVPAPNTAPVRLFERPEIELQLGRQELPPICCVCLGAADAAHAYPIAVLPGVQLRIPRCASCASRSAWQKWRTGLAVMCTSFAALAGLIFALRLEREEFWILFAVSVPLAAALGGTVAHLRTAPASAKVIDASRGVVRIRFRNPEFVAAVPGAESGR